MTSGTADEGAPLQIVDLATACVRFVERAIGLPLDFTADTLPVLDHYLRTARKSPSEEITNLVVPAAGAYFGEVVRRQLGPARWYWPETAVAEAHAHAQDAAVETQYRLEFERCFLSFNPLGSALEAVLGKAVPGYGAHFSLLREEEALIEASLARMGEVREEDFYRLAVRFETIEHIVLTLGDQASVSGQPYRVFGPEVYAALRDTQGSGLLH